MIAVGRDKGGHRLQCSAFRESSTCSNGRRVKRDAIESAVLQALQSELARPTYLAEFVKIYNAERQRLARQADRERAQLETRIGQIGPGAQSRYRFSVKRRSRSQGSHAPHQRART